MSSTITVQNSIDFTLPYIGFKPVAIGATNQPAITIANTILQTIVGPPFCWKWNREQLSPFNTAATVQDYVKPLADFGFIEKASVSGFECESFNLLGTGTSSEPTGRPQKISAQIDDGLGNITFRFLSIPDDVYPVSIIIQKKPPLISALSSTWTPIPDEYSYIYQFGFLALSMFYDGHSMAQLMSQRFVSHLVGASEGLTETQKAIFMNNWDRVTSGSQRMLQRSAQGVQALGGQ